jgi:hypothetical protein
MHPYATHLEPTIKAAVHTGLLWPKSSILELGCGHYSTPLLSSVAKAQNRKLQVMTSDSEWAKQFQGDVDQLQLIEFSTWPEVTFKGEWGMVLVDHEELVIDRYSQLFKLNEIAKVVVFHDSNRIEEQGVSWGLIHTLYRHVYFYDRYFPQTAILSNYIDPKIWF